MSELANLQHQHANDDADNGAANADDQKLDRGASRHARDELGMSQMSAPHPIQAALASAATFAVGAACPLLTAALVPIGKVIILVSVLSLVFLAMLGALAAWAGGANILRGALRVTFWGAFAMAVTAIIGKIFGTVV